MADLSKAETRTPTRDQKLSRRDSILPVRRNQEQVRTEMSGTMRTARRGDVGGAEALLDVSRKVLGAAKDFQQLDNVRWQRKAEEMSQQGTLDAATDNVDEAKMEDASYNRAVQLGRVRQRLAGVLPKTEGAIAEAVAAGAGKTLEERQALIDDAISGVFEGSILDEEGNLLDFGTAEANVYAANKLSTVRTQSSEEGYRKARMAMDDESVENFANFVAEAMMDGEVIDVASMDALLTPTADREKAKLAAFASIERFALADPEKGTEALERLVADVESGEGVDIFDGTDRVTLLAIKERATDARELQREKIRDRRYKENAEGLFALYNEGKLTPQEIRARAADDRISNQFARTLLNSLESDQRQREADARARRSEARAARMEARQIAGENQARELARFLIGARTGTITMDPLAGVDAVSRDFEGRYGVPLSPSQLFGIYDSLAAGAKVRGESPSVARYANQLKQDYPVSTFGGSPDPGEAYAQSYALDVYNTKINGGLSPEQAYAEATRSTRQVVGGSRTLGDADLDARINELSNK